jgi:hypothetical protein
MSERQMNFLRSFAVWTIFTFLPPLFLYIYARPSFRGVEYLSFFLPSLLIPALGNAVVWLPFLRLDTNAKGCLVGGLVGILVPIAGGLVWMRIFPGFESQPAIFLGSLVLAGPSTLGGGFAGVLRSRATRYSREGSMKIL